MLAFCKNYLAIYAALPLMVMMGIYFTWRLNGLQFVKLGKAWRLMFQKGCQENLSSFAAVTAVIGGNLGTGNIAGIAVALSTGGPGALFWMTIMAFLGAVIKYSGCYLGVLYRTRNRHGKYVGGPMYYMTHALHWPWLGKGYALLVLVGALTVGNLVQMNSVALPLIQFHIQPAVSGAVMSLLVGLVIFGGLRRFSVVVTKLVPFMALAYLLCCAFILIIAHDVLPSALQSIWYSAFSFASATGGAAGYGLLHVMRVGFDRGLFATDAGVGLAPIIHASVGGVESDSLEMTAHKQGLISMLSPLLVIIVCLITGLVLIVTGVGADPALESTNLCVAAFSKGLHIPYAGHIVTVTLFLFAFTTMLTWSFCADRAAGFLFGSEKIRLFRMLFVAMIPLGAMFSVHFVWSIADIAMNFLLLCNLTALFMLRKKIKSHNVKKNWNP